MPEEPGPRGNTLLSVLSSWRHLSRCIILVAFIALIIFGLIHYLVTKTLYLVASRNVSVQMSNGQKLEVGGPIRLLSFMVEPRGWSKYAIPVKKGDHVEINASGSVNIAMGRMIEALRTEYGFKAENMNDPKIKSRNIKKFTPDQKRKSLFAYPWNGPQGIDLSKVPDSSARDHIVESKYDRAFPDAEAGQLVAVIAEVENCEKIALPSRPKGTQPVQIRYFKSEIEIFDVDKDSRLCFIVNDEIYSDQDLNTIAWQDNLGFFSLLMSIRSK